MDLTTSQLQRVGYFLTFLHSQAEGKLTQDVLILTKGQKVARIGLSFPQHRQQR